MRKKHVGFNPALISFPFSQIIRRELRDQNLHVFFSPLIINAYFISWLKLGSLGISLVRKAAQERVQRERGGGGVVVVVVESEERLCYRFSVYI